MVVAESNYPAKRRFGLVVTGISRECGGCAFEGQRCGNVTCRVDHLRPGLFRGHRVSDSFAQIPYRRAGLEGDSEYPRDDVDNRRTPHSAPIPSKVFVDVLMVMT